jgi:hypothetical protein
MYVDLREIRLRRTAITSWEEKGGLQVEIRLHQFHDTYEPHSADFLASQQGYMPDAEFAGVDGDPIAGSPNGRLYVYAEQQGTGALGFYEARTLARRGDVVVDIWFTSSKAIDKKAAMGVSERQLERV